MLHVNIMPEVNFRGPLIYCLIGNDPNPIYLLRAQNDRHTQHVICKQQYVLLKNGMSDTDDLRHS